ncbi:MAG: flagellar basal-body rod protein FlgF [Rhodomicrobium sp.]|nr:MAG: flagellar basal-body rod protein FlgF [Rhodomicrobium sp.]
MENALRIGLSRQIALQTQMNVIANNLANVNTAGFKRDNVHLEEFRMKVAEMTEMDGRGKQLSYVHDRAVLKNMSPGPIRHSGNELDVAISGEGWFVIGGPDGERYSRNGEFKINNNGALVDNQGLPVLGEAGEIVFDSRETKITIARDGTISTNEGIKGKLRVITFDNEQQLKKEGFNLFSTEQPSRPVEAPNLMQHMVEQSNVKPVLELTRMIETVRAYTNQASMMKRTEELKSDAINKLAQMPG